MSSSGRADPFNLDVAEFQPTPKAQTRPKPELAAVRAVSEQHAFPSREAKSPPPAAAAPTEAPVLAAASPASQLHGAGRPRRVYRTGRNVQFNMKATAEAIERYHRLTNKHGWVLGETLEQLLDAFEATHGKA